MFSTLFVEAAKSGAQMVGALGTGVGLYKGYQYFWGEGKPSKKKQENLVVKALLKASKKAAKRELKAAKKLAKAQTKAAKKAAKVKSKLGYDPEFEVARPGRPSRAHG